MFSGKYNANLVTLNSTCSWG